MKTDIIINAAIHETRIALLEDSKLVEVWVERPDNERMVGHIYKGKVNAVIPGIQAAFVEIGMEKSAFLHVSDVSGESLDFAAQYDEEDDEDGDESPDEKPGKDSRRRGGRRRGRKNDRGDRKHIPIETMLKKGQELLVQLTKEPISTKGARITSQISLPGRYLVLMPGSNKIGVSRKISSWSERRRLRQLAQKHSPKGVGVIIRTVAQDKDNDTIINEIKELSRAYDKLMKKSEQSRPPALIHKEIGMTSGIIRDLLSEDVTKVVVDSPKHYDEIKNYLEATSTTLSDRVSHFKGKEPIFDHFDLEREIESIFSRKVWLKNGAFLVFDHAEAMKVIDVNSGRYIGKKDQEQTILNINVETAKEIARQLRLRDMGGIIVIDFIDMSDMDHRRRVEDTFAQALKNDRSRISISQVSEFGLMEMTRQRVRPSLLHTFAEPCPTCDGIGMVQSRETTVTKIERWLKRAEAFGNEKSFTVFVHPAVFEYLIDEGEDVLNLLKSSTTLTIDIVADAKIGIDEFLGYSSARSVDMTAEYTPGKKMKKKKSSVVAPIPSAPKTARVTSRVTTAAVAVDSADDENGSDAVNDNVASFGRKKKLPRNARAKRGKSDEKTAEPSAEKGAGQTVEPPAEKIAEKTVEPPAENEAQPAGETVQTEQKTAVADDTVDDKTSSFGRRKKLPRNARAKRGKPDETPAEKPEQTVEPPVETTDEQTVEPPAEKDTGQTVETTDAQTAEPSVEPPVETTDEKPDESPAEQTVEQTVETTDAQTDEPPAENEAQPVGETVQTEQKTSVADETGDDKTLSFGRRKKLPRNARAAKRGKSDEKSDEKTDEKGVEPPTGQTVEPPAGQISEQTAETTDEQTVEPPAGNEAQQAAETVKADPLADVAIEPAAPPVEELAEAADKPVAQSVEPEAVTADKVSYGRKKKPAHKR